jgi:hypothetical protein
VRIRHLQLVTPEHLVTARDRLRALSPYGPVKAGLTIWQTTSDQALTELLSSLERKVADLIYKSCTVSDTLTTAIQRIEVVLHSDTTNESTGTDVNGS